jgi:translation initiation factor 2 beta subunit (eIF-2beta)/eIF-5
MSCDHLDFDDFFDRCRDCGAIDCQDSEGNEYHNRILAGRCVDCGETVE